MSTALRRRPLLFGLFIYLRAICTALTRKSISLRKQIVSQFYRQIQYCYVSVILCAITTILIYKNITCMLLPPTHWNCLWYFRYLRPIKTQFSRSICYYIISNWFRGVSINLVFFCVVRRFGVPGFLVIVNFRLASAFRFHCVLFSVFVER